MVCLAEDTTYVSGVDGSTNPAFGHSFVIAHTVTPEFQKLKHQHLQAKARLDSE